MTSKSAEERHRCAKPLEQPQARARGGAGPSGPRAEARDETEAAEQEARAPAAETAEAEAADDAEPEDGMPGVHQEGNSEDEDERMVYEATDPSEPRCPSGDSSSESGDDVEDESPPKREGTGPESASKRAEVSFLQSPRREGAWRSDLGRQNLFSYNETAVHRAIPWILVLACDQNASDRQWELFFYELHASHRCFSITHPNRLGA